MTFAEQLTKARDAADLSQEALARECGVSVRAISALEQGINKEPRFSLGKQLERVLGVFFDFDYHYITESTHSKPDVFADLENTFNEVRP